MGLDLGFVEVKLGLVPLGLDSAAPRTLYVGLCQQSYSEAECLDNHEQCPYRLLVLLYVREHTCYAYVMYAGLGCVEGHARESIGNHE